METDQERTAANIELERAIRTAAAHHSTNRRQLGKDLNRLWLRDQRRWCTLLQDEQLARHIVFELSRGVAYPTEQQ